MKTPMRPVEEGWVPLEYELMEWSSLCFCLFSVFTLTYHVSTFINLSRHVLYQSLSRHISPLASKPHAPYSWYIIGI